MLAQALPTAPNAEPQPGQDPRLTNPVVAGSVYVRFEGGKGAAAAAAAAAAAPPGTRAIPLASGGVAATVQLRKGETVVAGAARLIADPGA